VRLTELNALWEGEARAAFERCCGASRWVEAMMMGRPFETFPAVVAASDDAFDELEEHDWLEAFAHHPQIGDVAELRRKFASTAGWAGAEQSGTSAASEVTLAALAEGNRAYRERFGYIFIVCATGKSAEEMLGLLRLRIGNDAEAELAIAVEEQRKITGLRLMKLLEDEISGGRA
jgi:2-oxo-4-hydroxy-4-carboxy-5-ureidoimidazoline decarboxylase